MVGVIDVGSNSVRLLLRENGRTIFKDNIITQLALDIDDGILNYNSMKRTADAVAFFVNKAKEQRADKIFAFGTCAVRMAKNRQEFIDLVKSEANIGIEVISCEKEAELGLKGVLKGKDGGIIDIGGASTEIIVSHENKVKYSKSLNIGVVGIKNICGQDEKLVEQYSKKMVLEYGAVPKIEMFGIGGTITSVAFLLLGIDKYDSKKVNGFVIKKDELINLKNKLFNMSLEERKQIKGFQSKRAEVICGGIVWLLIIMDYLKIENIIASEDDNLEGYLIDRGLYE